MRHFLSKSAVATSAAAVMSFSLLSGCKFDENQDLSLFVDPNSFHSHGEGCEFYHDTLARADREHFSGKATVSHRSLAKSAFQHMLFLTKTHKNLGDEAITYENPKDKKGIKSLIIGQTTITVPQDFDQMRYYRDHCQYLEKGAEQISRETDLDVFRLYEYAVNGALKISRDPHTAYEWKERAELTTIKTDGKFGGLGIEVSMHDGLVQVVSPIEGTPADKAGVVAGDIITHINGDPVLGKTLNQAVSLMRGTPKTDITITLKRGDAEPFDLNITRDIITIQAVKAQLVGPQKNIAHIRIKTFNRNMVKQAMDALKRLEKESNGHSVDEIILDFKNNPGGLLDEALHFADIFLEAKPGEENRIVATGKTANENVVRIGTVANTKVSKKLKVLINGGSASASEIIAGSFKDAGITVIGTPSFGKGTVQTLFPHYGGFLRLTTSIFFPGNSKLSNQQSGIIPNIVVIYNDKARDDRAESSKNREGKLERSIISKGKTRAGNKPEITCSVKKEFAGALSQETQKILAPYLTVDFRLKNPKSGKFQNVKMINAELACALGTPHVTFTPYKEKLTSPKMK